MPILGIWASQISGKLYNNSYDALGVVTVGAGGSSIVTFSGIPSTYQHLQIRGIIRSTANTSGVGTYAGYFFNNDVTTSNYYDHYLQGNGSSASAGGYQNTGVFGEQAMPDAGTTSNTFGAVVLDVLDYANTNKNKTSRVLSGYDANGSGKTGLTSNLWMNTTAINRIDLYTNGNFAQYSSFALYGVK